MTKEEKIKDAYREWWHRVEDFVDEHGWLDKDYFKHSNITYEDISATIDFTHDLSNDTMIPEEIHGIRSNNGWIKVNSEDDLPKESGMFWTIVENQREVCANTFWSFKEREFTFDNGKITHYQTIQKPELPIY